MKIVQQQNYNFKKNLRWYKFLYAVHKYNYSSMDFLDIYVVGRDRDTELIYEVKIDHRHAHARAL